jgi:hypothetical protein
MAQLTAMDVKLIRAFIASPGGLDTERKAAFAAAEEVNRSVARPLGGRLELIGWEETLSGIGRPQALINADMETCDLFIGVIWTSWGSRPSKDGRYTSGFEEEFELSRERHARTMRPTMSMFFKDVDPMQLHDPGVGVKKVLEFQERLRAEQTILYHRFANVEEFAKNVRTFLSTHVIQTLKEAGSPREERPAQPEPTTGLPSPKPTTKPSQGDIQDADFLERVSQSFRSEDGLSPAEVARLRLVATVAGGPRNDTQLVGVHDANLLYAHRAEFSLSYSEKHGLLACGLAGLEGENVPVWCWLAELNRDRPGLLAQFTLRGVEVERVGALTAVRLLGEPLESLHLPVAKVIQHSWLRSDTPASVKVAALRYLRDYGTVAELHAVRQEAELAATDTVAAAIEAAVSILLRDNEADAVRYLLSVSFETLAPDVVRRALAHLGELGSEDLVQGLDHRSSEVRGRTLEVLSERNSLSIGTIKRALEDDAAIVRLAGVRALDRLGQALSLDEVSKVLWRLRSPVSLLSYSTDSLGGLLFTAYLTERLRGMSAQPLEALLGAPDYRDAAYRALAARRIGDFGNSLRADLADGFRRYFALHWPDGIKPTLSGAANVFSLVSQNPEEDKKRDLIRSALDVVTAQRDKADLSLVRRVLDEHGISPTHTVIAYLKALGSHEDVARLAQTLQVSFRGFVLDDLERDFNAAAQTMLKLAGGDFSEMMARAIPERMKARLIDFVSPTEFAKLSNNAIVSLLLSDDAITRRAVAKKVAGSLSSARITKILSTYQANEKGGYYLITHWLDLGLTYSRRLSRRVASNKR